MEVDDPSISTQQLLQKLNHKKPKIPPTCLDVIREGMIAFGGKTFPVREVIASLGAVLNGTNGAARESALSLMLEMTRWIGKAPFNSLLETVRSAQKTEFERMCTERESSDQASSVPIPTVWLRKERPAPGTEADVVGALKASKAGGDDREFIEEIDLPKKLRATEYATLIKDEKWSEQLKALQFVIDALGPTPKMKSGCDVHDILSAIKGFLRHGHVQLQVSSLKIIALLADAMRGEFGTVVRPLTQAIIMKCKEKRLVPEVQVALANVLRYCLTFEPLSEDILEQIKNKKTPTHARVGLLEFLVTALTDMPTRIASSDMKPIAEALASCCEDSDPKVRQTSVTALSLFMPLVKSRGKNASDANKVLQGLEQTAPKIFKKMNEPVPDSSVVSSSSSLSSSSSSSSAPSTAPPSPPRKSDDTSMASKPGLAKRPSVTSTASASATGTAAAKKPSSAGSAAGSGGPTAAGAKKSAGGSGGGDKEDDNIEELSMSVEDAKMALSSLGVEGWDTTIQEAMGSAKWQEKVEALSSITQRLQETQLGGQLSAALVVYLSDKTSKFKISNVNILKAVIQATCAAAKFSGDAKFSKPAAWELIKNFGDSDKKTKELVNELLTALSESINPAFVVKRMKHVMDKSKAPLAHQHFLEWLKDAIKDFGASAFPLSFLGSFCQLEMENKISAVRTAAVEVMGALYYQLGPRMQSLTIPDDIKPALKQLLDAEFAKVGHDPSAAARASRVIKGDDSGGADGSNAIPRNDLCSMVDKNILSELNMLEGKTSWMNRKTAVEAIIAACEKSAHYLEANKGTGEIVKSLKARLNDTQANLKPLAAAAVGHIIASLEVETGVKVLRTIAGPLLGGLADNKKPMRDATVAALQMAVTLNKENGSAEPSLLYVLVPAIGEAIATTPIGRQELLTWLGLHVDSLKGDCSELANPLVTAMQDKTAAVRTQAESLLTHLVSKALVSRTSLEKATRDLPPALLRTLQGPIERMMSVYGTKKGATSAALQPSTSVTASSEPLTETVSATTATSTEETSTSTGAPAAESKPAAAPSGVRSSHQSVLPRLAQALGQPVPPPPTASSPSSEKWHLKKTNKTKRLEEFFKANWPQPPEEPGENELAALKSSWEHLMSADLATLLFPINKFGAPNQDACLNAMSELTSQLEGPYALSHIDFILRWCCYTLCLRESATGMLKVCELITDIFSLMRREGVTMHDAEASIIMPQLIDKCGHKSERHKAAFKQAIVAAGEVLAPNKINQLLLQGLGSKNKKSRVVCLEEILRVVETAGASSLGRAGVKEVASYLDNKDSDVSGRNAALELCYALYLSLGSDLPKLTKLMGDLSDRSTTMIEERIKHKSKSGGSQAAAGATVKASSPQHVTSTTQALPPQPSQQLQATTSAVEVAADSAIASSKPTAVTTPLRLELDNPSDSDFLVAPFRLEMTPGPQTHAYSPTFSPTDDNNNKPAVTGSESESAGESATWRDKQTPPPPCALPTHSPTPSKYTPGAVSRLTMSHSHILTGIYADIVQRIDSLLDKKGTVKETDPIHEEAKDYLKILHAIFMKEWAVEEREEVEEELLAHVNLLAERLCQCVFTAFLSSESSPPASSLGIDISLGAVSLATLFAMVKREDIASNLSEESCFLIFKECAERLVDARLAPPSADAVLMETGSQILRALNMILLKLAAVASPSSCMCALVRVMGCVVAVGAGADNASSTSSSSLPFACARPVSKLILRVISEEGRKERPFHWPNADQTHLLVTIHNFLSTHLSQGSPSSSDADEDIPLRTVKTILSQVVKALGGPATLALLEAAGIGAGELTARMVSKLSGGASSTSASAIEDNNNASNASSSSSSSSTASTQLDGKVLCILEDIVASADKTEPIRQLYLFKKSHPSVDLDVYLQRISSFLRRFVLDAIAKLENAQSNVGDENLKPGPPTAEENSEAGSSDPSTFKKPMTPLQSMPPQPPTQQHVASSPRAAQTDKIRGSLAGLTASLDLPVPTASTNSQGLLTRDSDLAARLAALKNRKN